MSIGLVAEPTGVGVRGTRHVCPGSQTLWIEGTEAGLGQGRWRVGEEPGEPDEVDEAGNMVSPPLGWVAGEVQQL